MRHSPHDTKKHKGYITVKNNVDRTVRIRTLQCFDSSLGEKKHSTLNSSETTCVQGFLSLTTEPFPEWIQAASIGCARLVSGNSARIQLSWDVIRQGIDLFECTVYIQLISFAIGRSTCLGKTIGGHGITQRSLIIFIVRLLSKFNRIQNKI